MQPRQEGELAGLEQRLMKLPEEEGRLIRSGLPSLVAGPCSWGVAATGGPEKVRAGVGVVVFRVWARGSCWWEVLELVGGMGGYRSEVHRVLLALTWGVALLCRSVCFRARFV